jgi:hemolysin activation/secretion protein
LLGFGLPKPNFLLKQLIRMKNQQTLNQLRSKVINNQKIISCLLILGLFISVSSPVLAQSFLPYNSPNDNVIELPDFIPEPVTTSRILPLIPMPQQQVLYSDQVFILREVRFSGNTELEQSVLEQLVAPYIGRAIKLSDLQILRDTVTAAYIKQGYVSSGAVLPEQTINDGIVNIKIIEGGLAAVNVISDGQFKPEYFAKRLLHVAQPLLNVNRLEQRLYLFQQDSRIKTINAELQPSETAGLSVLNMRVQEASPVTSHVEFNNHHAPAIGSQGLYANWRHANLLGNSETLFLGVRKTEGLLAANFHYEWPLSVSDDLLSVFANVNNSDVIEGAFAVLDIESRSHTFGVSYRRPLLRHRTKKFEWFVTVESRKSESLLLGEGFSFSPGPENGISKLTLLRVGTDLQVQSPMRVLAARARLNMGVDALGATIHSDDRPDGEFVSLLLQGQWAQRLALWQSMFIARVDLQWSNEALLGLEQFAIGGHNTVRGYRENSLVRDQGAVASLEWRIPYIKHTATEKHELALYFDGGHSKNKDRENAGLQTISSLGLGLLGNFNKFNYQFYWAESLKDLTPLGESDLQDDGWHFRIGYHW